MKIFAGLATSLLGASAIACLVLGLSSLYVGLWLLALGLLAGGLVAGFFFLRLWDSYLNSLGAASDTRVSDTAPAPLPTAPVLFSAFWLAVLAAVLLVSAATSAGTAQLLSLGTGLALALTGGLLFVFRPRQT